MDNISVLFWNSQGLSTKIHELNNFVKCKNIDFVCVCETFLKPNMTIPLLPNYSYFRKDRTYCRLGGLLIFYKNQFKVSTINLPNTKIIEALGVEIQVSNKSCYLIISYLPGGTKSDLIRQHFKNDLRILTSTKKPYFLCGDFNSKHKTWHNTRNNLAGKILFETCNNSNFFINFPKDYTHIPTNNLNNPSTIDIIITNSLIESSLPESLDKFTSNHNPVSFSINTKFPTEPTEPKFDYHNANWKVYRKFLKLNLHTPI